MTRSVSSLITTMVFLLAPGAVHAGFVIVLYDGETTITIADNGPNDASPIEGSIIVGIATSAESPTYAMEAFLWTSEDGMLNLGAFPRGPGAYLWAEAYGVSADGSRVVGDSLGTSGQEAFIWDATNGMRELDVVLTGLGVDLTGWELESARAISADGTVIVGYGRNPSDNDEAWMATIPVPEPSAEFLQGAGLLVLMGLTMRGRQEGLAN